MQRILQLFSRALRLSLVVGLLCCTAATARAQGGGEPINLNATLTVTLTERPATAVLDEITRKTGIKFAYDPEDIRRLPAVSGEFKKVTVHELLDKCIAGSTFKYAIENNYERYENLGRKPGRRSNTPSRTTSCWSTTRRSRCASSP